MSRLSLRFEVDCLDGGGDLCALCLNRVGEFSRAADIDHLPGGLQSLGYNAIRRHGPYIGGDLFLELVCNAPDAEETDETIHFKRGKTGFARGRDIRRDGRSRRVVYQQ